MNEKRGQWEKLSSRVVHKNPYYSVREDTVIKPDGSQGFYNVIQRIAAVFIVALDKHFNVYLVGLHRYTNDTYSIEIPSGSTDGQKPLVAAKRELQEETGLTANKWQQIGILHPANGIVSGKHYIFIASGLKETKKHNQKEEGITEVYKVPIREALSMVRNKQITDADSVASLAMAAIELDLIKNK